MDRDKKEKILDAAVAVFARLGYKKASIDEIAKLAGVGKGTVYLASDSKEDLFYQAIHRELRGWVGELSKMIDPRVPADQLLLEIGNMGFTYLDGHPLVRDLFIGLFKGDLPGWGERFDELRNLGQANVVEILRLGIRQGLFREDLEISELSRVLRDLQIAGYLFHSRHSETDPDAVRRRQAAALDLVLNGLRRR